MRKIRNINEPIRALSNNQLPITIGNDGIGKEYTKIQCLNEIGNCGIGNISKNILVQNYRTILMFFVFSLLFLSVNVLGVFAAWGDDDDDVSSESTIELLKAVDDIKNESEYFKENVLWVPTSSGNGMFTNKKYTGSSDIFEKYIGTYTISVEVPNEDKTTTMQVYEDKYSKEFGGYWIFYNEVLDDSHNWKLYKLYFKYIELKRDEPAAPGHSGTWRTFSKENTGNYLGLWLYSQGNAFEDSKYNAKFPKYEYVDAFSGELLGQENYAFREGFFYWPASENIDTNGILQSIRYPVYDKDNSNNGSCPDKFVESICLHDFRNYSGIEDVRAYSLGFLNSAGRTTHDDSGRYDYEGSNTGCYYLWNIPSRESALAEINKSTGITYTDGIFVGSKWYKATDKFDASFKSVPSMGWDYTEVYEKVRTYKDNTGHDHPIFFIARNDVSRPGIWESGEQRNIMRFTPTYSWTADIDWIGEKGGSTSYPNDTATYRNDDSISDIFERKTDGEHGKRMGYGPHYLEMAPIGASGKTMSLDLGKTLKKSQSFKITPEQVTPLQIDAVQDMFLSVKGMARLMAYIGAVYKGPEHLYFDNYYYENIYKDKSKFSGDNAIYDLSVAGNYKKVCKKLLEVSNPGWKGGAVTSAEGKAAFDETKFFEEFNKLVLTYGGEWACQFYALTFVSTNLYPGENSWGDHHEDGGDSDWKSNGGKSNSVADFPIYYYDNYGDGKGGRWGVFAWMNYPCGPNGTQLMLAYKNGYFKTARAKNILSSPIEGTKVTIGEDDLKVYIVDVFKAFGISDSAANEVLGLYKNGISIDYPLSSLFSGDSRKVNAIKACLTQTTTTGSYYSSPLEKDIILKPEEIEKGKINWKDAENSTCDLLQTNFRPYILVVEQKQFVKNTLNDNSNKEYINYDYVNFDSLNNETKGALKNYIRILEGKELTFEEKEINEAQLKILKEKGAWLFDEQLTDFEQNRYVDITITYTQEKVTYKYQQLNGLNVYQGKDMDSTFNSMVDFNLNTYFDGTYIFQDSRNYFEKGSSSYIIDKFTVPFARNSLSVQSNFDNIFDASFLKVSDGSKTYRYLKNAENAYKNYYFLGFNVDKYTNENKDGTIIKNTNRNEISANGSKNLVTAVDILVGLHGTKVNTNNEESPRNGYIVTEYLLNNIAKGNYDKNNVFESLLYLIITGIDEQGIPYYYNLFEKNKDDLMVAFKIVEEPIENFGFDGKNFNTLKFTQEQLGNLKTNMLHFVANYKLLSGSKIEDVSLTNLMEYEGKFAETSPLLAALLSTIFDKSTNVFLSVGVNEGSEDILISNSHVSVPNISIGGMDAVNRTEIDWFSNMSASSFEFTSYMTWDASKQSILDPTYTSDGKWIIKNETQIENLDQSKGLFEKNTEGTYQQKALEIQGEISIGRVPEANTAGVKVEDFKLILIEDFSPDEKLDVADFLSKNIVRKITTLLDTSASSSARKMALNNMTDTYADGILLKNFSSPNTLGNIKITPIKVYKVAETKIEVENGKIKNKLTAIEEEYSSSLIWSPGMAIKYTYTYSMPNNSSYKTTSKYIMSTPSIYNANTFGEGTGFSSIKSTLLHFALVPNVDSNGNINSAIGNANVDTNRNNDVLTVGVESDTHGNFEWLSVKETAKVEILHYGGVIASKDIACTWDNKKQELLLDENLIDAFPASIFSGELPWTAAGTFKDYYSLRITVKPTIKWEDKTLGAGARTTHTMTQMAIGIDKTGIANIANASKVSRTPLSSTTIKWESVVGERETYIKAGSTGYFQATLELQISIAGNVNLASVSDKNSVKVFTPGSKIGNGTSDYACGKNDSKCDADNSIQDNFDEFTIVFKSAGERDNIIADIIATDLTGTPVNGGEIALGDNNWGFGVDEAAKNQILFYLDENEKIALPTAIGITAFVERSKLEGGDPESWEANNTTNEINKSQVLYWDISYISGGMSRIIEIGHPYVNNGANDVGYPNGQIYNGEYKYYYPTTTMGNANQTVNCKASGLNSRVLYKVGDRIGFQYQLTGLVNIAELKVKVDYRNRESDDEIYDFLDANISNNTKTEVWKAQVDIEVKTIDAPDSVVVPLYLLCDNDEQSFKSGKYVYTELPPEYQEQIKNGDFPTLTTQHTLQVKIDDKYADQEFVLSQLNSLAGTIYIYALKDGIKYYPTTIEYIGSTPNDSDKYYCADRITHLGAINGDLHDGKIHVWNLEDNMATINCTWENMIFEKPGEVDWFIEFWPWADNVGFDGQWSSNKYATEIANGQWSTSSASNYKDNGRNASVSVESMPWTYISYYDYANLKLSIKSTNNRHYKETPLEVTIDVIGCDGEIICNQKNYPYLANEVRWTAHFKWRNNQYQIADWTGVDLDTDEYRLSNSMVNGYWNFGDTITYGSWENFYTDPINHHNWGCSVPGGSSGWYDAHYRENDYGAPGVFPHDGYRSSHRNDSHTDVTQVGEEFYEYKIEIISTQTGIHQHWTKILDSIEEIVDGEGNISIIEHFKDILVNAACPEGTFGYVLYDRHNKLNGYASIVNPQKIPGPDNNTWNWGPNGLVGKENNGTWKHGSNSPTFNKMFIYQDEVGDSSSGEEYVGEGLEGYCNKFKPDLDVGPIPKKYYDYIYKGKTLSTDFGFTKWPNIVLTSPKTHGSKYYGFSSSNPTSDPTIGNWDSLTVLEVTGSSYNTASGTKYSFYSEKTRSILQIATSRNNFTWITFAGVEEDGNANSKSVDWGEYTVYTGESFKVRGIVQYFTNRTTAFPSSPVQNLRETTTLVTTLNSGSMRGLEKFVVNNDGMFATTKEIVGGTYTGKTRTWTIVDFDACDDMMYSGDSLWFNCYNRMQRVFTPALFRTLMTSANSWDTPYNRPTNIPSASVRGYAWLRASNKAWTLNMDNVDTYSGLVKTIYTGMGGYNWGTRGLVAGGQRTLPWISINTTTWPYSYSYPGFTSTDYWILPYPQAKADRHGWQSGYRFDVISWHKENNQTKLLEPSLKANFGSQNVVQISNDASTRNAPFGTDLGRVSADWKIVGSKYAGYYRAKAHTSYNVGSNGQHTRSYGTNQAEWVFSVLPYSLTDQQSVINVPKENQKQEITISFASLPFQGIASTLNNNSDAQLSDFHPYSRFRNSDFGDRYLCDTVMDAKITIMPSGIIMGTGEDDEGIPPLPGDGVIKEPDSYIE